MYKLANGRSQLVLVVLNIATIDQRQQVVAMLSLDLVSSTWWWHSGTSLKVLEWLPMSLYLYLGLAYVGLQDQCLPSVVRRPVPRSLERDLGALLQWSFVI